MRFLSKLIFAVTLLFSLSANAKVNYLTKNSDDLKVIQDYLNSIKNLTATFTQKSPDGGNLTGKFYLSRPGKMRIEYDRPSPILIVVNDSVLTYQDLELEEVSYLTTNSTPASFLTRENISFWAKDVEVTDVKKEENLIRVSVEKKNRKEAGEFSLTFEMNPIRFIKMEVKNDLDQITVVNLTDTNFGSKISSNLFFVKDSRLPK